jgi:hypothetical protein
MSLCLTLNKRALLIEGWAFSSTRGVMAFLFYV